jgi:hypothetical protein
MNPRPEQMCDDAPTDDLDVVRRHDYGRNKESAGGERTRGRTSRRETRESKRARVAVVGSTAALLQHRGPLRPQLAIYHIGTHCSS